MAGEIHRRKKSKGFVTVDTHCLRNKDLKWDAKGLHTYLMQLPEDWRINLSDLENRSANGREGTTSPMNALLAAGYVYRERKHTSLGKFEGYDYHLFERPEHLEEWLTINGKPVNGKTVNGSAVNGKPATIKYEIEYPTDIQNKNEESGAHPENTDLKVEIHDPEIPGVKIVEGFVAPVRGETIDDLEKPIIEWVFGPDGKGDGPGRDSVRKWYADAFRKVTVKDVREMITKFCSVYATIGDEGKRQRMLTRPLDFFKLSFKGFIKSQDSFEAKAQEKQGQKNVSNQDAVYEDPKIPVYRAKNLS